MSRVDKPTLQCDRCGAATQDLHDMARYHQLTYYHQSGHDEWDLCPSCWLAFRAFLLDGGSDA
jgi:hypothetical protein